MDRQETRRGAEIPARITKLIDDNDVKAALRNIGGQTYEIGDLGCSGLCLRVRARSAVWSLRGRLGKTRSTWRINDAAALPAEAARRIALVGKSVLEDGKDPRDYFQRERVGGEVTRTFDPEIDGWTWEKARDGFLEEIKKHRADATWNDYRKTLHGQDMEAFEGKLVKHITAEDIKTMRDGIEKRGATRQARHTLIIVKSCLKWVASKSGSGLTVSPGVGVVAPMVSTRDDGDDLAIDDQQGTTAPVPSMADLGRLPWLLADARINPAIRCAAIMVLATVQRREDIVSMRWNRIRPVAGQPVWHLFPKSRRPHPVPLTPLAQAALRAAKAMVPDGCPWVFPQQRLWRKTDSGDGHLSSYTLWRTLRDVGFGFGPHAVRATFATFCEEEQGYLRNMTKVVLDHRIDPKVLAILDQLFSPQVVTHRAEGQSGDVTATHYAKHLGLRFKVQVLNDWDRLLMAEIAKQSPDGRPLPGFLSGD